MKFMKKMLAWSLAAALIASCLPLGVLRAQAAQTGEEGTETVSQITVPADDLPGHEELYNAYIDRLFYGGNSVSFLGEAAREQLNPQGQLLYDYLKENITKAAAGEISSTRFKISADQLAAWGGSVEYAVATSNDALTAFQQEFDVVNVIGALLHDCPYELYWYDKVTGVRNAAGVAPCDAGYEIRSVVFLFSVVADYQTSDYDALNPSLDTTLVSAASAAAANARAVVEEHGEDSDYDMLKAYKDEICARVRYDYSASPEDFSTDADPWQLVYVFDGDTATNVVCEGYAKAFQYLCDLSAFNGDTACYTVTGKLSGGTGSGGHMWNIVTLDGQNYLADITNSDASTVGWDGSLFLAGAEGDISTGYVFTAAGFAYDADTKALWGTGENSILKLAQTNYAPAAAETPEDNAISQEEFEAALAEAAAAGETYTLDRPLTLTSDLVIPKNAKVHVIVSEAGTVLTVPASVTLTNQGELLICGRTELVIQEGGCLDNQGIIIQENLATLTQNGELTGNKVLTYGGDEKIDIETSADLEAFCLTTGDFYAEIIAPITLTEDMELAQGKCVYLTDNGSGGVVLTVPDGVTLTNKSTIYIQSGTGLTIEAGGTLDNQHTVIVQDGGTLTNAGAITGNAIEGTVTAPDGDQGNDTPDVVETIPMHRMYNPNSGEHFYTGSEEERDILVTAGWRYEGVAWQAPKEGGLPIYRVYNPNAGDHHYTGSMEEVDMLVDAGWKYEGVCWNTPVYGIPVYRLYNPNAVCGSHHYTTSAEERDILVGAGWRYEGVAWNGVDVES